jgi:tetratricopeptide (TPR) repeat protein
VILYSGCTFTPEYEERAGRLGADAVLHKPVPLAQLVGRVAELVARGAATAAPRVAPQRSSAAEPEATELSGRLDEESVPSLLHHLHGLRASGVLELRHGKKKKLIQIREGRPVAVRSNLVNECLGNLLVASGTITWDAMHESLRRAKRGEGLQGQILMAMQMLDEEDLARALRSQGEEKLFEAFSWRRGRYRFHRGAQVKGANALSLKRSTANVIMDGVRQRTRLEQVDGFLADRSRWHPVPGEKPFYLFQEIDLDDTARGLLERADGRARIADLALDEWGRRTLYALLVIELLELREGGSAEPSERVAEAPRARAEAPPPEEEPLRAELAAMAERLRGRDYFGVLGVSRNAGDEDIRHAYTDLAKRTHPDRFSGSSRAVTRVAEEVFGLISRAYEVVGERDRRLAYLRDEANRERDAAELEEGHRALRAELEFQKGEVALRAKRYELAADHFRKAVEAYPDEGEYRAYFGWARYLCDPEAPGRLQEALRTVQEGRKLAPDREKPYLFLGRLCKAGGRVKMAEKMFTRAVQLDPDCVEALRELRLIHMRREKSKGLVRRILGR